MIAANIPFAIGWFMLYRAEEVSYIYIGLGFLGLAYGVAEAAIVTYVGN